MNGHIFITLIAYHIVQTLRYQLKSQGINLSWQTIRNIMASQHRVTTILGCEDEKTIHIRKSTTAEPKQKEIYNVLNISSLPGKTQKTII